MTSPGRTTSAVIVNYEAGGLLLACLRALDGQPGLVQTIVVDNGSRDGSAAAAAAQFPGVELLTPERNAGFAGGCNLGAARAVGDLLLFLNPDVRLSAGAVRALADQFVDPRVGVVGPPIEVARTRTVEYGATTDLLGMPVALDDRERPPLYVSGCALMTRKQTFRELGGFDTRFFLFMEDVDYCWRSLLAGFDVRVVDVPPVQHEGGASTPGGYVSDRDLSTTRFRLELRERNTLAMLLKCYSGPAAALIVPLYVLQTLATAALLLAAHGRRETAGAVIGGLAWNIRELPRTLTLRRAVQRSRVVGDRVILHRIYPGILKLRALSRFGLPTLMDDEPAPVQPLSLLDQRSPATEASGIPYRRNRRPHGTHEVILRQVRAASSVLDVGCSTGYLGEELRGRGCRVWGLDRDAAAVAEATPWYEDVRILDLDVCDDLPWPDQSFDVVLCADVLEHLRDPVRALGLVRRYLSPGGRLVLSLPNVAHASVRLPLLVGRFDYRRSGILDETHLRLFTFRTTRALVESSGFTVERVLGGSDHFGALLARLGSAASVVRGLLAYNIVIVARVSA
jgi:GT2 family glycosyltransferase/SAM-dependent methyltransferase